MKKMEMEAKKERNESNSIKNFGEQLSFTASTQITFFAYDLKVAC